MVGVSAYAMGYYEPKERRTAQLNVRVPKSVQDGLRDLARLWTHLERTRTGDQEQEVTVSDVAVRLLEVGLDGAWAEGGGRPQNEDQWKELLKAATKHVGPKK